MHKIRICFGDGKQYDSGVRKRHRHSGPVWQLGQLFDAVDPAEELHVCSCWTTCIPLTQSYLFIFPVQLVFLVFYIPRHFVVHRTRDRHRLMCGLGGRVSQKCILFICFHHSCVQQQAAVDGRPFGMDFKLEPSGWFYWTDNWILANNLNLLFL